MPPWFETITALGTPAVNPDGTVTEIAVVFGAGDMRTVALIPPIVTDGLLAFGFNPVPEILTVSPALPCTTSSEVMTGAVNGFDVKAPVLVPWIAESPETNQISVFPCLSRSANRSVPSFIERSALPTTMFANVVCAALYGNVTLTNFPNVSVPIVEVWSPVGPVTVTGVVKSR